MRRLLLTWCLPFYVADFPHSSAPDAPWFAACQPDAPCITPGTYAYLGAAAALRYVIDATSYSALAVTWLT